MSKAPPKSTNTGPDAKRAKEAGKSGSGETAKPAIESGKSGAAASAAQSAKPKK
jgi:hypothetical protein